MRESDERFQYRMSCKHIGMYERCNRKSGTYGNIHVSIGCTPDNDCPRMKRYDKLHKEK